MLRSLRLRRGRGVVVVNRQESADFFWGRMNQGRGRLALALMLPAGVIHPNRGGSWLGLCSSLYFLCFPLISRLSNVMTRLKETFLLQLSFSFKVTACYTLQQGSNRLWDDLKVAGSRLHHEQVKSQPATDVNRCQCTRIKRHQRHFVGGLDDATVTL